jgi:hypothetical protein
MANKVLGIAICCFILIAGLVMLCRDENMDQAYFSPQKIDSMQIRDMITEKYFSIHNREQINAICMQMGHGMRFDRKDPKGGTDLFFVYSYTNEGKEYELWIEKNIEDGIFIRSGLGAFKNDSLLALVKSYAK